MGRMWDASKCKLKLNNGYGRIHGPKSSKLVVQFPDDANDRLPKGTYAGSFIVIARGWHSSDYRLAVIVNIDKIIGSTPGDPRPAYIRSTTPATTIVAISTVDTSSEWLKNDENTTPAATIVAISTVDTSSEWLKNDENTTLGVLELGSEKNSDEEIIIICATVIPIITIAIIGVVVYTLIKKRIYEPAQQNDYST